MIDSDGQLMDFNELPNYIYRRWTWRRAQRSEVDQLIGKDPNPVAQVITTSISMYSMYWISPGGFWLLFLD